MISKYLTWLENEKCYSKATIKVYCRYLSTFEKNEFNIEKTMFVFKTNSSSTKRVCLSSIKGYLKFIGDPLWAQIELPRKTKRIQDFITNNEYFQILNFLNKKNKNSILKKIIIRLLYETGLRASELLEIKASDIETNKILINGKGHKQRNVWISDSLKFDLEFYIKKFNINEKLFSFGYKNLYKKIRGTGKYIHKKLTPHMFRRGFATYCIKKNVDIFSLSQMMGHSDLNTTKTYIYDFDLQTKMQNLF